ncbi:hypothetical protein IP88_15170 [alpha proteobacterium AAP81b]|nr:hypothetical protein IP88_15170 [alpha proteobacterium AAP81b]
MVRRELFMATKAADDGIAPDHVHPNLAGYVSTRVFDGVRVLDDAAAARHRAWLKLALARQAAEDAAAGK